MATQSKVEKLKSRFTQQARAGMPFNPVDGVEITGANVERLKLSMETFAWSDCRFVTFDQALTNGWQIGPDAESVVVKVRDPANGTMEERALFNAANVIGMPSLDAMLEMTEEAMLAMRGERPKVAVAQEVKAPEPSIALTPPAKEAKDEAEDEIVVGPARAVEQDRRVPGGPLDSEPADLFLGTPAANVSQVPTGNKPLDPSEAATAPLETAEQATSEAEFAVMAPYWLDGLHNFAGIEMAKEVNRLIESEKLAKDKAAVARMLTTYPEGRRLGVEIVPRAKYLNDPHLKANVGEPTHLLAGELVRDKEGAYRPSAGGPAVLKDNGTALVLKNKSDQAYRGAMELALAKGWKAIELKGKPKVLAQAWLEAKVMGLEVVNYSPSEQDRQKLAQRMAEEVRKREAAQARAESQGPETVEVRPVLDAAGKQLPATVTYTVSPNGAGPVEGQGQESVTTRSVTRVAGVVRDDVVSGVAPVVVGNSGQVQKPAATKDLVTREVDTALSEVKQEQKAVEPLVDLEKGARLVEHGAAPYKHEEKNKPSYFATVEDEMGNRRTVWGKDLQRSLSEAGAKPGDSIALQENGRKHVEVDVLEADGSTTRKPAERVNWVTTVLSKAAALAQDNDRPAEPVVADSGLHLGPIVKIEDGRVAQKSGRDPNKLVWHDVSKLDGELPAVGEWAEIHYSQGKGRVKGPAKTQELSR